MLFYFPVWVIKSTPPIFMNIYASFSIHLKCTRTIVNHAYICVITATCYSIISHAWPCLLPTAPPLHRNEEVSRETMADYRTGSVHSPDTRPAWPWWDVRSCVIVGLGPLISDQREGDRCLSHDPGGFSYVSMIEKPQRLWYVCVWYDEMSRGVWSYYYTGKVWEI